MARYKELGLIAKRTSAMDLCNVFWSQSIHIPNHSHIFVQNDNTTGFMTGKKFPIYIIS